MHEWPNCTRWSPHAGGGGISTYKDSVDVLYSWIEVMYDSWSSCHRSGPQHRFTICVQLCRTVGNLKTLHSVKYTYMYHYICGIFRRILINLPEMVIAARSTARHNIRCLPTTRRYCVNILHMYVRK